jgi:hypothetical protein
MIPAQTGSGQSHEHNGDQSGRDARETRVHPWLSPGCPSGNVRQDECMDEKKSIPVSLTVVAILFILSGISAAIGDVVSLMYNHLNLIFGVLQNLILGILMILIGIGLFGLSRGWRTCALVINWIAIIGLPILALLTITVRAPLNFTIGEQLVGHPTRGLGVLIVGIEFAVVLWVHHVLTRPDVKELFQKREAD